jgi:hypothetical protein
VTKSRKAASFQPFWNKPETRERLLKPLEQYETPRTRDNPGHQSSSEIQRLSPTQSRPTYRCVQETNDNSIPDWVTLPEPTADELADIEDFWQDVSPEDFVDTSDTDSPRPAASPDRPSHTPKIGIAFGPKHEFKEDLTPEPEVRQRRILHIEAFADCLLGFHAETTEQHGREYLRLFPFVFDDPLEAAAFQAFCDFDFADRANVIRALLTIDECGFPRVGNSLQRLYPPHRVADCGVRALVSVTSKIESLLATNRKPRRSDKKIAGPLTIRCTEKPGCELILKTEEKRCSLKGNRMYLVVNLLSRIRDRDQRPFARYREIFEAWPPRNRSASDKQNLRALASRIKGLNEYIEKKLGLTFNVIKNFDHKGYRLCEDNVRWEYDSDEHAIGSARSDFNAGMAIRGKHAGVAPSEDPEEVRELDAATPRRRQQFIAFVQAMTALALKGGHAIEPNDLADIQAMLSELASDKTLGT